MLQRSFPASPIDRSRETDTVTAASAAIFAVRDEAERLGISVPYETLMSQVASEPELYREAVARKAAFVGGRLVPPSILRVCDKLRRECRGMEAFGRA